MSYERFGVWMLAVSIGWSGAISSPGILSAATLSALQEPAAGETAQSSPADAKQEPAGEAAAVKEATDAPARFEVKRSPLVVVESLEARVESQVNHPIKVKMDQWTELEVKQVVAQGAAVKNGEMVLQFDTREFDEKLAEAKLDMRLAELDRNLAQAARDYAERTWEMDRELAETQWNQTRDDIQFWLNIRKNLEIEAAKRSLANSEFAVQNSQEELNQLEKMYTEDELTEESEKIVLERTKRELDDSRFWLKRSQIETDRELNIDIPRNEADQTRTLRRGELEFNKKMIELPAEKQKGEVEFEKSQLAFQKSVEEFEKLNKDYQLMVLKAPADGVLYHGEFQRGKWTNGSGSKLRSIAAEDKLTNDTVVFTVLDPKRIQLRCDLTEAQAALLRQGMKAQVTSEALPGKRFQATVQQVSQFPVEEENYDCVLTLEGSAEGLRPGLGCQLKIVVYRQDQAIQIPTASLFTDDGGITHYVFVWKDGKAVRQEVVTGREAGDKTEILSGLDAGSEVLEARPEEE